VVSGFQFSMDLAPDKCTMYITVFSGPQSFGGPFDVCTSTQESTNHWQLVDDLRVLPNWQVLRLGDSSANLVDSSGQVIQAYRLDPAGHGSFRRLALDPDGTSFWACCALNPADLQSRPYILNVFHVDISSGQILDFWPLSAGNITVYGPPLLGDADVNRVVDTNEAGRAEAFSTTARYSGQLTRIHLWVDSSSTAGRAIVGVYSDRDGRPGALQEQTTISDVKPGAWNYADMASIPVTAGQHYWIAILGPKDGGMLGFRDAGAGRGAEMSAQPNLTALPAHWSGAVHPTATGPLSAYGS
jgi:hypothetical protein